MSRPCCLLLQHSIPAPYLRSVLPCCWCIGPVFIVLWQALIVLALALSWTSCLVDLCSTLLRITLYTIVASDTMIVRIVHCVNRVLPNVQLVTRVLVLKCLVLGIGCHAVLLEVLGLHQLLVRLCVRFNCIYGILSEFKLSTSFLLDILAASRWRCLCNWIAVSPSHRSLSRNGPLLLHEALSGCLLGCYNLFGRLAQRWADSLTAVGAGSS